MELFGGLSDIAMSPDGDMLVENRELKRTNGIQWFIQEVNKILRSSSDWFFSPGSGAALDRFYGRNNTREVAAEIKELINYKITAQRIHFPAQLDIQVIPLSINELKVYINLIYNQQTYYVSSLIFDLQKGSLKETQEIATQQSKATPNKHPYSTRFL